MSENWIGAKNKLEVGIGAVSTRPSVCTRGKGHVEVGVKGEGQDEGRRGERVRRE